MLNKKDYLVLLKNKIIFDKVKRLKDLKRILYE